MGDKTKLATLLGLLAALVVVAYLVPLPSPVELRGIAASLGPAAPVAFFGLYAVLCSLPLPRTAFNLAAGLLLGHALGVAVALAATMTAAVLGYLLARQVGKVRLRRFLPTRYRGALRTVDTRITGGGATAVASLRLIPVVPFAPMSYCCGLLSVRPHPYLLGTAVGSLPGTVAVVVVGDAMTGATPPALIAWYLVFALVGAVGVWRSVRNAAPARVAADING